MKIHGVEGMTSQQLAAEVSRGGKFVIFQYCFSIVLMSFKRRSDIYFVKSTENAAVKGLKFTLLSIVLGWWGLPWGIIFTVQTLATNLGGGKDVTQPVLATLNAATTQPDVGVRSLAEQPENGNIGDLTPMA